MADDVKAKKLAAARKKLKEYQKSQFSKKGKKTEDEDLLKDHVATSEDHTPVDSLTSSTHSTLFETIQDTDIKNVANNLVNVENSDNIVKNSIVDQFNKSNDLSNYFDNITQEHSIKSSNNFYQNLNTVNSAPINIKPELNSPVPTQISDNFHSSSNIFESHINDKSFIEDITKNQQEIPNKDIKIENVTPDENKKESALKNDIPLQNVSTIISNTESLRQLSSQLNSLIEPEVSQDVSITSQLELRNQELASMLTNEQLKTEQLNLQQREYINRITELETEVQQLRNEYDAKLSREIGPLQEQLQYHVQTVGILVGEKTELTMALNQSQSTIKLKTSECEELQGRLKASRHRVSELEKEINFLKSSKDNLDKHEQEYNREFERLRLEYNLLQDQFKEVSEDSAEMKQKLNAKINECLNLQQQIQEKNSQLSLSQLKVQQLTSGENIDLESQLEILNQQKLSFEQQIPELMETIKVIKSERDQASQQYQQYIYQLNGQIQTLAEKLEAKNSEIEAASKREQSLVKHICDLEKHLQQLQNEKQLNTPVKYEKDTEIKKLEENITELETEKTNLVEKIDEEVKKQLQYEAQIQEKDLLISELQNKIEQLKDQPDASKLLAAMESDKVAASRAVEQNKKLKEQLEELHNGFIKMSNDKLDLTEKLQHQEHLYREVSEQVTESKSIVQHLHSVIAVKDKELTEIQNRSEELEKQILQQNQMIDRFRHYEAQDSTSNILQEELQHTRIELQRVQNENQLLQGELQKYANSDVVIENQEINNSIPASTDNNENEQFITLLKEKIQKLEQSNADLQKSISISQENKNISEEGVNVNQCITNETAIKQLEERFKKTMIEVADLTEEKQRLEHLVLQLQSETETIGEYVALYHCQRAMLKEKTLEKDEQLKQLSRDREDMLLKLNELNSLVQNLIVEKGAIPEELLEKFRQNSKEICDVHKHVNQTNSTDDETNEKDNINDTNVENNNENFGTAGKIIALLSEIKTSNFVQPIDNIKNFHPCPWCSGQLITV